MQAQQASFMLLPDFTFSPDGDVQLGRVLPVVKKTKLPNASQPLSVRVDVVPTRVTTYNHGAWHGKINNRSEVSGGVSLDVSLFTGVGGGVDGNRGPSSALDIKSSSVIRETFTPNDSEIAAVLKDDLVQSILKRPNRPPVYLITGRMLAAGASITTQHGLDQGGGAHINADLTSIGAPINVGVNGKVSSSKDRTISESPKQSFILAYRLLKLQKRIRSIEQTTEVKWALFSDEQEIPGVETELSVTDLDIDTLKPQDLLDETEAS